MKQLISLLLIVSATVARAQYSADENFSARIRAGAGYTHDFPGLHGVTAYVEYSFPLNEWLQGGVGIRRVETGGFPRTTAVKEFTKATALDVNLLFVPFHTETAAFRIGSGYSFSFYNIRRAYPVYTNHTDAQAPADIAWPSFDASGRVSGLSLTAEYEYNFSDRFSGGVKISVAKAYGNVISGGPFLGVRL